MSDNNFVKCDQAHTHQAGAALLFCSETPQSGECRTKCREQGIFMPTLQMQPEPARRQQEQQRVDEQRRAETQRQEWLRAETQRQERLRAETQRQAEAQHQEELRAAERLRVETQRQEEHRAAERALIQEQQKEHRQEQLRAEVAEVLTDAGYNPPRPPPLAIIRATRLLDPHAWTNSSHNSQYESIWREERSQIE